MTSENLRPTPGQTVGPFFGYALPFERGNELVASGAPGAITLTGHITDGAGAPIPDALLELWQPDESGRVPQEHGSLTRSGGFSGFGRAETDPDGRYEFTTIEPGALAEQAPAYFAVALYARGLLDVLFTRIYLPGTSVAADSLLRSLTPDRARTLVANRESAAVIRHDMRLQGHNETVFLHFSPDAHEQAHG